MSEKREMNYDEWESAVPDVLKQDRLWHVEAYRLGLFAADLGWSDMTRLREDRRTIDLADQLYRATGSISANIAEGYSRSTGKDRARFLEYALGSARESRDWYFKGRHVLGERVVDHRLGLLTQIIRLVLTMVPQQRKHGSIRDARVLYHVGAPEEGTPVDRDTLESVLEDAPTE